MFSIYRSLFHASFETNMVGLWDLKTAKKYQIACVPTDIWTQDVRNTKYRDRGVHLWTRKWTFRFRKGVGLNFFIRQAYCQLLKKDCAACSLIRLSSKHVAQPWFKRTCLGNIVYHSVNLSYHWTVFRVLYCLKSDCKWQPWHFASVL